MKPNRLLAPLLVLVLLSAPLASAGELAGKWTSTFDSQIGVQKYRYVFQPEGDQLTGRAQYDHSMGQGETTLANIKVEGDRVSFSETLNFEGMELVITYAGKFVGDEIHLTRTVGEFAIEEIVLQRAKQDDTAAE